MQIPILSGVYTDQSSDVRTAYPRNLIPVPQNSGVSTTYLRPADGIKEFADPSSIPNSGIDRGGINWNGTCYRVSGGNLVSISSTGGVTNLGTVGTDGKNIAIDYSFDRIAIASNGNLFYWDGVSLTQVTDPDLGTVVHMIFIDGYYMTTDGESLVVTDLADPTMVNPLKYGSSEVDPDPVVQLMRIKNEAYAINRYTIEVFSNIGGDLFPFQRIDGAQISKGAYATNAASEFMDTVAFVGSGRNESLAVYIASGGQAVQISTREIDITLQEADLTNLIVESRNNKGHEFLYIHLADRTLVYDANASKALSTNIWFTLTSGLAETGEYRARNFVYCYDKWLVGDTQSAKIGEISDRVGSHFTDKVSWDFSTVMMYNSSNGLIVHDLEMVALTGLPVLGDTPRIATRYSQDGQTWSQKKYISVGSQGSYNKRLKWLQQGSFRQWRIQQFSGDSDAMLSPMSIEARIEPLNF